MDLTTVGVWASRRRLGGEDAAEAARVAEELGYGAFWLGGSPALPMVRPLLQATSRIVVATGIVNVWEYEPAQLAAEHAELTRDFPGRLLLGIGISHPSSNAGYARPLATMRAFLDGLDAAPAPVPHDELCIAALAPKMLALSAERSRGTHPYFVPAEHARVARAAVGPDALVAPEVACVIDADPERARATARQFARTYLRLPNYASNLERLGYTADDLDGEGSDRVIDAVVPHGTVAEVAAALRAHLDAGADHVCVQVLGEEGVPRAGWTALAAELGLGA
jgi:probable F420-dependent oxidoreductase